MELMEWESNGMRMTKTKHRRRTEVAGSRSTMMMTTASIKTANNKENDCAVDVTTKNEHSILKLNFTSNQSVLVSVRRWKNSNIRCFGSQIASICVAVNQFQDIRFAVILPVIFAHFQFSTWITFVEMAHASSQPGCNCFDIMRVENRLSLCQRSLIRDQTSLINELAAFSEDEQVSASNGEWDR